MNNGDPYRSYNSWYHTSLDQEYVSSQQGMSHEQLLTLTEARVPDNITVWVTKK